MRLRVLVYNVHGFRAGTDRVARVVSRWRPDVVLLNESGGRLRLRRFARTVGMEVAADPWSPLRRRVKNAVVVRDPWTVIDHRLHRFAGGPILSPRGALVATIGSGRDRVTAVAAHLGLHPVERRRHAEELVGVLEDVRSPVILGGDLNERPDGRAASLLANRWRDVWLLGGDAAGETFPVAQATARIDYLFVSDGVGVEGATVPGDDDARAASDHRPLVAELTLPGHG
ncbi:MAG TPA: endonuclease/exonuclease/phosphatase family protein [Actinomycetota bacterium]|nr:endonuclease/exonuclease/phosphatase family protein [Actinomycetota bacterium]